MNNSIYAFNADQPGSQPIWHQKLATAVPAYYGGSCPNVPYTGQQLGILSTPVADLDSQTLYVVYATPSGKSTYAHYIAALDLYSGEQRFGSPNQITATVRGNGYDANHGYVSLNQTTMLQRPALTLANGTVYAAFASCGPDPDPYHGWVVGYNKYYVGSQTALFNTTPNGSEGGIWQSGRGIAVDDYGYLYASTGNGTNSATDFSDSVIKLSSSAGLIDWFTPPDFAALTQYDLDLSSSGPLYTGSTRLLLAGGKEGVIYVMNPFYLGKSGSPIQSFQATTNCGAFQRSGCHQIHGIAYWDSDSNPLLYVWGVGDNLRAYRYANGRFNTTPDSQSSLFTGYPGGTLALSANDENPNSGVLWAISSDGVLHAFQATNVSKELYNTAQNAARDNTGSPTRFAEPTVANGKVYVPTSTGQISVFGLLDRY